MEENEKNNALVSDSEADRTGATLTPEQASRVEEETPKEDKDENNLDNKNQEDKTPDDSESEDKTDEDKSEDGKSNEEDDSDKSEDKPDPLQNKPKRSIYDDLKDKKRENREQKSEIETLKSQIAEKDKTIFDLTRKAQEAETPEEKKEVEDEIKAIAEDIGANPEGVAKLTDFLTKRLLKPTGEQISKEDLDAIKELRQSQAQLNEQKEFIKEWNSFVPSLKTDFPHATEKELEVVQEIVNKLAHTNQYHDKEIDYIYFKEKEKISKLISPKRPSYEGGDSRPNNNSGTDEVELSEKSSPMDVQKSNSKPPRTSLEIRSTQ